MHQRTAHADLRELPVIADQLRVRPIHARLARPERAVGKTWLGWKITANRIDLADRAAIATIFDNHRQVAGAQKLFAGRLAVGPRVDAEGHYTPIAKVDHQPGLIGWAVLGARHTTQTSCVGGAKHCAGRMRRRWRE